MLEEKNNRRRSKFLVGIRNKQAVALGATPKKVTLPTLSWEKKDGRDGFGSETRDQNQVNNKKGTES